MAEYPLPRDIAEHVPAELSEFILSVDPLEPENTRLAAAYVLLQNGITSKAALMDFEVNDCRKGECCHVAPKPLTVLQLLVSMQALCQRAECAASSGVPCVGLRQGTFCFSHLLFCTLCVERCARRLATALASTTPSRSANTGSDIAALVNVIRAEENKVHIDIGSKVEVRSTLVCCCVVAACTYVCIARP